MNKQSILLAQLNQEKKSLQVIIEKLESKKSLTEVHFANHRGRYSWPVKGRLVAAFGSPMAQGKISRQGVVLVSKAGAPVRAIAAGQVVFAKWLKGFGLLVIINHGDGYMSLYGRNQTIIKQPGDWVQASDVIATVGQSGGFTNPGLYFGIRYKGKAQNPQKWVRQ